jgi:hypothetical protein
MSGPVKLFRSTDAGAPNGLNNAAGTFLAIMEACLVTGYGSKTLSSLSVSSGVATATVNAGHGFTNFGDTGIGQVVLIEGATPSELNGEKRINVTGATTFTFAATGVADGSATGSITAKIAPAGWEKPFSGTNKAVYRQPYAFSNRRYLRIDDTGTTTARVRAYSYLEDVDGLNGLDLVPTDAQISGGGYISKSNAATVRDWYLIADDTTILFVGLAVASQSYNVIWHFGDAADLAGSADAYATFLITYSAFQNPGSTGYETVSGAKSYVFREITQLGTSFSMNRGCKPTVKYGLIAENADGYPPMGDGVLLLWPVYLFEPIAKYRGRVPGVYGGFSYPGNQVYVNVLDSTPLAGRVILSVNGNANVNTAGILIDVIGPWE